MYQVALGTAETVAASTYCSDPPHAPRCSRTAVQASIGSNTYVITGTAENKTAAEMLPSMMSSMAGLGGAGGINAAQLKMLQEALAKVRGCAGAEPDAAWASTPGEATGTCC